MSITGDEVGEGGQPYSKYTITPPSSVIELPPSPPPTDEKVRDSTALPVLNHLLSRFLRALNANLSPKTPLSFDISPGAYARATKQLAKSEPAVWAYVQDKLRSAMHNSTSPPIILLQ